MNIKECVDEMQDLKEGAVAKEDIIVDNKILVKKGSLMTRAVIDKLKNTYLERPIIDDIIYEEDLIKNNKIKSLEERILEEEKEIIKKDNEVLKEVEKSLKSHSESLIKIFDNLKINSKNDINDVRIFSKKIIEQLHSPRTIIKNIVLQGSGSDVVFRHSVNVTALSLFLGKWIGLKENRLNLLMYSAILHDFGKDKIANEILLKKDKLNEKEIKEIKKHPIIAYELIKNTPYLDNDVKFGVLMHHERLDGTGYPLGMKGEQINQFARIIAIADTFDALNSNRIHKSKKNPFEALEIIRKEALTKLDFNYSEIFIEHIINYYIGEYVLLNNNKVAKIIHIDSNNLSEPLLLCDNDFIDLKKNKKIKIKEIIAF